jgi:hypothetical protein
VGKSTMAECASTFDPLALRETLRDLPVTGNLARHEGRRSGEVFLGSSTRGGAGRRPSLPSFGVVSWSFASRLGHLFSKLSEAGEAIEAQALSAVRRSLLRALEGLGNEVPERHSERLKRHFVIEGIGGPSDAS